MAYIRKVANLVDRESNRAYEVFEFTTVSHKSSQIRVDRAQSRDLKAVYRALLRANADLPIVEADAHYLVKQAIESVSPVSCYYAATLGWQGNAKGFMFSNDYLIASGQTSLAQPPQWAETEANDQFVTVGKLKGWKAGVARQAVDSSRLVLLTAASFAAPLVRFTDRPNPGFNLFGLTQNDMKLAATLVGSILGQSAGDAISDWLIDPPTLLNRARHFNDLLFLAGSPTLSPAQMITLKQHERLVRLRAGHARANTAVLATTAGLQPVWRGVFVTLLPYSHFQCNSGSTARGAFDTAVCWDIPPAGGVSVLKVTVLAPHLVDSARGCTFAAAQHHRGKPIRSYIRYLVGCQDQLPAKVSELKMQFRRLARAGVLPAGSTNLLDDFGLLYAGGCMAIEAGVLPWRPAQLHAALHACLAAAVKHQRAGLMSPKAIQRIIRQQLRASNLVHRELNRPFGPDQHDGFYDIVGGRRRYTIHSTIFRRWFGSSARTSAALMWLHTQGLLVMGDRRAVVPSHTSVEWAERTPRWPDGRVQKSLVFYELPPLAALANRNLGPKACKGRRRR